MLSKYRFAFLLSLFFHIGAFALFSTGFVLSGQASTPTRIDIVWNETLSGQSDSPSTAQASPQRKIISKEKRETAPHAATQASSTNSLSSEGTHQGSGVNTGVVDDFRLALRTAIEQRKEYPALARARRQQGQVLVGFTLTKEGHIIDVHLVKPTIYELLNQAALTTVQHVGFFRQIPDEVSSGNWNVSVPIDFKLN